MNGSLSPSVLLSLRSSFSPIVRALFPHLGFHASLARSLARIPGVLRPSDGPFASSPVQSCSPRCLILRNVPTSHTVFSVLPSLTLSLFLSFECSLSLSLSLSLSSSRSCAIFVLYSVEIIIFFPLDPTRQHCFRFFASYTLFTFFPILY